MASCTGDGSRRGPGRRRTPDYGPLRASEHNGVPLGEPFTQFTAEERRDRKEESRIVTVGTPSPGAPAPQAPSPGKPARRWPDPGAPWGAVLYAVIAGLIVWIIISILSHIDVLITWHLSPSTARSGRSGCTWPPAQGRQDHQHLHRGAGLARRRARGLPHSPRRLGGSPTAGIALNLRCLRRYWRRFVFRFGRNRG
jgi:hypothetical protein